MHLYKHYYTDANRFPQHAEIPIMIYEIGQNHHVKKNNNHHLLPTFDELKLPN